MILFLAAAMLEDYGDYGLFCKLIDKYKNEMFNSAYAVLRDVHLAEDAVNEALMHILRNFATVNELSDAERKVYFVKSAKNSAIDLYRKRKLRWDNEFPLDDCAVTCGAWDSTFGDVSRVIDREAVIKALNTMEPELRNLIQLCIVEEKSISEAARMLGCPRTTLEYRLNKAKQCFAKEYLKIMGQDK